MYRLTLVKRSAITKSKPLIPCTQHARWMAQRPADLEHEEYKPWANENSTCGTTRETVDRRVASDNCVDAEKELNEDREESEVRKQTNERIILNLMHANTHTHTLSLLIVKRRAWCARIQCCQFTYVTTNQW